MATLDLSEHLLNNFILKCVICGEQPIEAIWQDQNNHWCSTLEQGGDCMHFEDYTFCSCGDVCAQCGGRQGDSVPSGLECDCRGEDVMAGFDCAGCGKRITTDSPHCNCSMNDSDYEEELF